MDISIWSTKDGILALLTRQFDSKLELVRRTHPTVEEDRHVYVAAAARSSESETLHVRERTEELGGREERNKFEVLQGQFDKFRECLADREDGVEQNGLSVPFLVRVDQLQSLEASGQTLQALAGDSGDVEVLDSQRIQFAKPGS